MIFAGKQESQESLVVPSGGGGEHAAPDLRTLRTPVSCRSPEPPCRPGTERGHAIGARWASECPPAVSATARGPAGSSAVSRGGASFRRRASRRVRSCGERRVARDAPRSNAGVTASTAFVSFASAGTRCNSQEFVGIPRNPQ